MNRPDDKPQISVYMVKDLFLWSTHPFKRFSKNYLRFFRGILPGLTHPLFGLFTQYSSTSTLSRCFDRPKLKLKLKLKHKDPDFVLIAVMRLEVLNFVLNAGKNYNFFLNADKN